MQERWPTASAAELRLRALGAGAPAHSDHGVPRARSRAGAAAQRQLERSSRAAWLAMPRTATIPTASGSSGLSPYLHFGHSVHQVFEQLAPSEAWTPSRLGSRTEGKREGWWGMSPAARPSSTSSSPGVSSATTLPPTVRTSTAGSRCPTWAKRHPRAPRRRPAAHRLLARAARRPAETQDPLWNAAQRQLVREGRMHNYLRMLWGKKVLEWSATPAGGAGRA